MSKNPPANITDLRHWADEAARRIRAAILAENPPDDDTLSTLWREMAMLTASLLPAQEASKYQHSQTEEIWQGVVRRRLHLHVLELLDQLITRHDGPPTPPAAERGEGGTPPADPFAELRQFARDELKGQERAVIEALCDAGGELPIANLAIKDGVGWDDANKGFESAQRRLNQKIKKQRWKLTRQNNAARLTTTPKL